MMLSQATSPFFSTTCQPSSHRFRPAPCAPWPLKTPTDILSKVTADIERALSSPSIRKSFEVTGAEVGTVFGPDFGLFMKHENEKWGDVIKSSGAAIIEETTQVHLLPDVDVLG